MENKQIPSFYDIAPVGGLEEVTPQISKCRVRIFYKYKNRNHAYITDEFAEKLISKLPYVPVVGIYNNYKKDFTKHNKNRGVASVYGCIPQDYNGAWQDILDKDGVVRKYYTCDVYLYNRIPEHEDIYGNPQSLEFDLNTIRGKWVDMDGEEYYVYDDADFIGLSVLGKDVEPAFEGAAFYELMDNFQKQKGDFNMEKIFSNENLNAVWDGLNPNYEATGEISNFILSLNEENNEVIYFSKEDFACKKKEYSLDENSKANFSEEEAETVRLNFLNEEQYNFCNKLIETYGDFQKVDEKITEMSDLTENLQTEKLDLEQQVSTFSIENERLKDVSSQFEQLTSAYNTLKEANEQLTADFEELNQAYNEIMNKQKEELINEYSKLVAEDKINEIKEKIGDFSLIDLEKELLFEMRQSTPNFFEAKDTGVALTSVRQEETSGIARILEKYKK